MITIFKPIAEIKAGRRHRFGPHPERSCNDRQRHVGRTLICARPAAHGGRHAAIWRDLGVLVAVWGEDVHKDARRAARRTQEYGAAA